MNYEEKESLKIEIAKRLTKIDEQIIDLKELSQPIEPDCAIGRVSRMDAIVNKTINQQALKKANDKLNKINISLERIDDNDFGTCIQCRKPIPIQRLLLMPGSICINCAR